MGAYPYTATAWFDKTIVPVARFDEFLALADGVAGASAVIESAAISDSVSAFISTQAAISASLAAVASADFVPDPTPAPSVTLDNFINAASVPLLLVIDGVQVVAADVAEDLPRAVLISLFSWRRANPDDDLPGENKYGWWGDSYPSIDNDRIGSRLWLLGRSKLTNETIFRAKEYTEEALQWLVDDGVAQRVEVQAERQGLSQLAIGVVIVRGDKRLLNIRFVNVWDYLNAI